MVYRNKAVVEIPEEDTEIWSCTREGCNGWMRDNFAFDQVPTCRLCSSEMTRTTRMLPMLVNTNLAMKSIKKGVLI